MSRDWYKNLRNIEPYIPGEQSKDKNIVKINANENPYPPSPKAMAVLKSFDANNLRFYPNANSTKLKEAIAKFYGVGVENVFVGNGSDDVLAVAFQSFFNSDKPIVYPDLTYSFYPVWCSLFGIKYKTYPVDDNFRINPEDYKEQNGGVVIPNPNAPTSLGEGLDFVEKIGVKRSIEKIDEADLVIYLLNVESDIDDEDKEILSKIQNKGIKLITVINKIDKGQKLKFDSILDELKRFGVNEVIKMSVLNNEGIDELKNKIEEIFNTNDLDFENELIITNERHRDLLNKSKEYLEIAKKEIENNEPIDIVSIVIKNATKSLGEIIGADVNQDIVNKIFEKFCLGK